MTFNYKNKYKYKIFIILFIFSPLCWSQQLDREALSLLIPDADASKLALDDDEKFISPTQNTYSNVVKQLRKVSNESLAKDIQERLRQKQIELSTELCRNDEKACYLLENYSKYQASKAPPSIDKLEVFGLSYFAGYPLSFNQPESVGQSPNYVLRIGDTLKVSIYGNSSHSKKLIIDSDGSISIPQHGNFNIAGKSLEAAQTFLQEQFNSNFIGSYINISLVQANTIQIYVFGDVINPGAYNISSVSRPINAIIASGGFTKSSSLRNIEVYRENQLIKKIDLYDFLIDGKSDDLNSMQNGDLILVKSRKTSIKILGSVARPAIYELKNGEIFTEVLDFAMGLNDTADSLNISIERLASSSERIVLRDFKNNIPMMNGDIIKVGKITPDNVEQIFVNGEIRSAGIYPFKNGQQFSDFVNLEDDLLDTTYNGIFIIQRFTKSSNSLQYIALDPMNNRSAGFKLQESDAIYFFSNDDVDFINKLRKNILLKHVFFDSKEIIKESASADVDNLYQNTSLKIDSDKDSKFINEIPECISVLQGFSNQDFLDNLQSKARLFYDSELSSESLECPEIFSTNLTLLPVLINNAVPVFGAVVKPGLYPITNSVGADRLLAFASGISSASNNKIKYDYGFYSGDDSIITQDSQMLSSSSNLKYLNILENTELSQSSYIELIGEFKFPGKYFVGPETTLLDIYEKSGFLTDRAFPVGGILIRESIKSIEEDALNRSQAELADILATAVTSGKLQQSANDTIALVNLISNLSNSKALGRLVTEFDPWEIKNNSTLNIYLEPGDKIYMPKRNNTVTVIGSVLNSITVPFNPKYKIDDYVNLAGGYKDHADIKKTYAVLPNGMSVSQQNSLFDRKSNLIPGSTIIVPRKARPLEGLALAETITPILANLSITMASIASVTKD